MILVYRFGLLEPTSGAERVHEQMRLGHWYRNDLVAICHGERTAKRAAVDSVPAVQAATAIAWQRPRGYFFSGAGG